MMRNLTRTAVLARIEISPRLTRLRAPLAGALSLRRRRMGSDAKHDEHGHSADVIERSPDGKLYVNDRYMGPQEDGVFRWPHVPPPSQPVRRGASRGPLSLAPSRVAPRALAQCVLTSRVARSCPRTTTKCSTRA
jgi:hypothetical protein